MRARAQRRLEARAVGRKPRVTTAKAGEKIPPAAAAAIADDAMATFGTMLGEDLMRRGLIPEEAAATVAGAALRYYVALAIGLDKLSVARELSREGSHETLDIQWDAGLVEWERQAPNFGKGGR